MTPNILLFPKDSSCRYADYLNDFLWIKPNIKVRIVLCIANTLHFYYCFSAKFHSVIAPNFLVTSKRIHSIAISPLSSDEHRWAMLIVSAQAGNESDYRVLLNELSVVISAYLRKRLGNTHFIEDCVQESLIAIHQARHTYDPKRPFKPWFFAIVHHKLVDYLRQKNTKDKYEQLYHQEQELNCQEHGIESEEQEVSSDYLFSLLSSQHREVLTLTKIHCLSSAETATKMGISESAVKVRVHRAIKQLKKKLSEINK